jgi:hypothetical protein
MPFACGWHAGRIYGWVWLGWVGSGGGHCIPHAVRIAIRMRFACDGHVGRIASACPAYVCRVLGCLLTFGTMGCPGIVLEPVVDGVGAIRAFRPFENTVRINFA